MVFVMDFLPYVDQLIVGLGFWFGGTFLLGFYFVPKVYLLLSGKRLHMPQRTPPHPAPFSPSFPPVLASVCYYVTFHIPVLTDILTVTMITTGADLDRVKLKIVRKKKIRLPPVTGLPGQPTEDTTRLSYIMSFASSFFQQAGSNRR
jgi:hypothetical protein